MSTKTILYLIAVILSASIFSIALISFESINFDQIFQDSSTTNNQNPTPANNIDNQTINQSSLKEGPFRVVKVRDGDTIELDNGMVVRYLYVDTPETVKVGTKVQCFGPESSQFNKEYVLDKVIYLVKDHVSDQNKNDKDQYGRDLRLVFIEGKDTSKPEQSINGELIRLGFAKAKFYSPNTTHKKMFQDLEQSAKDQKLGLWGSCELK